MTDSASSADSGPGADSVAGAEQRIRATLAAVGATGWLCVREIGRDQAVEIDADEPVAVASVIKIVVSLAFARAVAAGRIDPAERLAVPAELRFGGPGTAGFEYPVELGARDLALSMMTVSDNAATDVVIERVGRPAIDETIAELGLTHTALRGGMRWGAERAARELGLPGIEDIDAQLQSLRGQPDRIRALAWLDPARANCSTPREIMTLLEAIWTDRAGTPDACRLTRELMSQQVNRQRLASGFAGDDWTVASKTGTLPSVRNEAGVVTAPDGRRFAVAVFTRAESLVDHLPAIDAAIGTCARIGVDALRGETAYCR